MKLLEWSIYSLLVFTTITCKSPGGGINFFTIEQDIEFGEKVKEEIENNPQEYPILDENEYADVYTYIRNMTKEILNSPEINYKNEFAYEVKIINRDDILNAFCTPGGYIYVYTGLIKYLNNGDELAGVMGHEIAHADLRHSTDALTRQYGYQILLDVLLGRNTSMLKQMALTISSLSYSKKNEAQADEYSVRYLKHTSYNCAGAAGFFEKIINENGGDCSRIEQFFSTHPCPDNRVANIHQHATNMNCRKSPTDIHTFLSIKSRLN